MEIIYHELIRLVDEYYKCENFCTQEILLNEIKRLTEVIVDNG